MSNRQIVLKSDDNYRLVVKFVRKISMGTLRVGIWYSMHSVMCDVISYRAWSCDMDKISVNDKNTINWNRKKREKKDRIFF